MATQLPTSHENANVASDFRTCATAVGAGHIRLLARTETRSRKRPRRLASPFRLLSFPSVSASSEARDPQLCGEPAVREKLGAKGGGEMRLVRPPPTSWRGGGVFGVEGGGGGRTGRARAPEVGSAKQTMSRLGINWKSHLPRPRGACSCINSREEPEPAEESTLCAWPLVNRSAVAVYQAKLSSQHTCTRLAFCTRTTGRLGPTALSIGRFFFCATQHGAERPIPHPNLERPIKDLQPRSRTDSPATGGWKTSVQYSGKLRLIAPSK